MFVCVNYFSSCLYSFIIYLQEFRCPFTNSCEINAVSRRFCQRCRLAKCFTVGMKKEWILTEQARIEKRVKVETKRCKRSLSGDFSSSSKRLNSEFQHQNSTQSNVQQFSPSDSSPSTTNGSAGELHVINLMSSNNGMFHHAGNGTSSACLPSPSAATTAFHHVPNASAVQQFSAQNCPALVGLANGNALSPFQAAAAAFQPRIHQTNSGFRGGIQLPTTQHQPRVEPNHAPSASVIQLIPPVLVDQKHAIAVPNTDRARQKSESSVTVPKELLINLMRQCSGMLEMQQGALSTSYTNRICSCVCTCGARPGYPLYPLKIDKSTISDDLIMLSPSLTPFDAAALDESLLRILDGAIIAEFKDTPESLPSTLGTVALTPGLSQFEQEKLDELFAANECMQEPLEKLIGSNQKKDNPRLIDVINLTDIAIKRIIRMSKLIQGFKNLCQEDQIALLKGDF